MDIPRNGVSEGLQHEHLRVASSYKDITVGWGGVGRVGDYHMNISRGTGGTGQLVATTLSIVITPLYETVRVYSEKTVQRTQCLSELNLLVIHIRKDC